MHPVSNLGGLTISRRIDTLTGIYTYRVLDIFTNNTASSITTTILYHTDLGSDFSEYVVEERAWRSITFEDVNAPSGSPVGENDPVLAFTFGNNAFTTANAVGDVSPNQYDLTYNITVAPGQSLGLLQFATLIKDDTDRTGDVAFAAGISDLLISLPDYSGLSAGEIATILNFGLEVESGALPEPSSLGLLGFGRYRPDQSDRKAPTADRTGGGRLKQR